MINYIALLIALCLSGVSAYYSIIGLTAIFAGAYWPIIFMGAVLEAGKLTTASWLYNNWHITPKILRYYLTAVVIILMMITSMGIFGFLSKAHIDQTLVATAGSADKIAIIDNKIEVEQQAIKDIDIQIAQIDNAITKMTDKGQAQSSLNAADKQRKIRNDLIQQKNGHIESLSKLREEKIPLESSLKKIEAEVGPIKYIAQLVFSDSSTDNLERAVRGVILLLVIVFDPLAVLLLVAVNIGLRNRNNLTIEPKVGILKIDNNILENGEKNVPKRQTAKKLNNRSNSKPRRQ